MVQRKIHGDIVRTRIISVLHAIAGLSRSARLISAAAIMAIGYPSQASQGIVQLPSETYRTEKQSVIDNRKPVTTIDIVDLKKSSNAINVLANDSDPDGDGLTLIYALAKFGAVVFTPDGLVGYAQNPGQPRLDRIIYTVRDDKGGIAYGTVDIVR